MLCDRRIIKSQTTTSAVTLVLYGKDSLYFCLVRKITRASEEETVSHK